MMNANLSPFVAPLAPVPIGTAAAWILAPNDKRFGAERTPVGLLQPGNVLAG